MATTSNSLKNVYRKGRKPRKIPNTKTNRMVKSIVRQEIALKERKEVELKAHDITHVNGSTFSYNGLVTNISLGIGKGDSSSERTGNVVQIKGLLFRFQLVPNFQFNNCRIMVVRWNAPGIPTAANILQFTGAVGASMSPLIRDSAVNFQILHDNLITVGADMANEVHTDKVYIKNVGKCVWDDSNNSSKGQIFFVAVSDASPAGSQPGLFMHARVKYTDQ